MAEPHVASLVQLLRAIKAKIPPDDDSTQVTVAKPDSDPTAVTIAHHEAVPRTVTAKNIWRHPDAHPLVLDLLLLDKYAEEWLGWESETIELRVPTDFGVDRVSDLNISKIQSMKTLHLIDTFWERWEVFVWCSMPLNAIFPDFQVMQVPTVLQCSLAVDIANRVRDDMEWSSEMKAYLAAVHRHAGILVPQSPLNFVDVDTEGLPVDIHDVVGRWAGVRASKNPPAAHTPEDEQLRRMLDVYQGLEQNRAMLRQQLGVLRA